MHKGYVAVFLPAVVVALTPALTSAQPSASQPAPGALTPEDVARIKSELREEVKAELREELREALKDDLKAEMKNAGADSAADDSWSDNSAGDSWAEEEWKWEEPATPELNFFEIDGYFRFRYDMFNNLDLGTYYRDTRDTDDVSDDIEYGPFAPGFAPPTPLCNTDVRRRPGANGEDDIGADSCANRSGLGDTLGGANMRLRLEPTLNVYEDIKIRTQIDILDN
ncbi:MAG: hypothetical protein AAFV29_17835, partial [Myxococcota bacterium]